MTVWRLERLRLWRTRRAIVLGANFLLLGLASPVLTYYLPDLVKGATNDGVQIIVPKQTALDGIMSYAGNLDQLSTLIVIVVAASTFCFDAHPILAAFYRTRQRPAALLLPRYLTVTAATLATLVLGTLGAWYETAVLLGSVDAADLLVGLALEALWFVLVTAVVAAFAAVIRGVAGTVGATVGLLLGVAAIPVFKSWFPTRLADGLVLVLKHQHELWRPVLTATFAIAALLGFAVRRLGRIERGA